MCTLSTWDGGEITTTTPSITVRPQELFPTGCASASQGTYIFYALAVSARTDTTTDIAATHYFSFSVGLDFVAPDAPMLSDAAGDRQIGLTWSNSSTETLTGANVYVDTSVDCMGTSTTLVAGNVVPASLTPTATVTVLFAHEQDARRTIARACHRRLSPGGRHRARFRAQRECAVERRLHRTRHRCRFWDAYCAEHGLSLDECHARYSSCTALPGRRPLGWIWLVGLAALLMVVGRRASARGAR